jgi:hypothetical protein
MIHLLENGGGSSSHFSIDKGGGDIQNAHGATNKAAVALQLEVSSICFTHVIIAPCDNKQRHLLNGTQAKKDEFLNEVVKPDVTSIHLCQTTEKALCVPEPHGVGCYLNMY